MSTVQRRSYGGPVSIGGGASTNGAGVGETDPGIEPEPSEVATGGKFFLNRGRKVYEMKNHLGNVLAVVSDVKIGESSSSTVSYYAPDIVEMTDYYPFGMQMVKRHYVADAGYRFGFNGKENDDEWNGSGNMLDFGARLHDPRLGRWLSLDPLATQYPSHSDYCYAANNPVFYLDKGGKSVGGYLIKLWLEYMGFDTPEGLTKTLDEWGIEGEKRKVMAFVAGAAYTSTEVNIIDVSKGLILELPPVKAYRVSSKVLSGENAVDALIAEIPFAGRYKQYVAAISELTDTESVLRNSP